MTLQIHRLDAKGPYCIRSCHAVEIVKSPILNAVKTKPTMLYAIKCRLGPIQAVISAVSTKNFRSGSASMTDVGIIARYAASPVGCAGLTRPRTTC